MNRKWFLTVCIYIIACILLAAGCTAAPAQPAAQTPVPDVQNASVSVEDVDETWDGGMPVELMQTTTFRSGGTYVLSGAIADGQLIVECDSAETVRLVLNGVSVHCKNGPAVYVKEAGKVVLVVAAGTRNFLSDGGDFESVADAKQQPTATVFSMSDLTLNGSGELTVTGKYKDGITSRDALVIAGGTIRVNAADDGVMGRDSVLVTGGEIAVACGGQGLKSTNDKEDKGFIDIQGGSIAIRSGGDGINAVNSAAVSGGALSIAAGDDGIHADGRVEISGGEVRIAQCYEGIEAQKVSIVDGVVHIQAANDGINAAGGNDGSGTKGDAVKSSGGEISIGGGFVSVAADGDGIDSNGDLYISGGVVLVSGPEKNDNGSIDYDGNCTLTGGTLIVAGSAERLQYPEAPQQPLVVARFDAQQAGTRISIVDDASGGILMSFNPGKRFEAALISLPLLSEGNSYTLYVGGTVESGDEADGLLFEGTLQEGNEISRFTLKPGLNLLF